MKTRIPTTLKPAASVLLKKLYRKAIKTLSLEGMSLKQYAKDLLEDKNVENNDLAERWFFNKRANTSNPVMGIGHTRGKKKKNGQQKK